MFLKANMTFLNCRSGQGDRGKWCRLSLLSSDSEVYTLYLSDPSLSLPDLKTGDLCEVTLKVMPSQNGYRLSIEDIK